MSSSTAEPVSDVSEVRKVTGRVGRPPRVDRDLIARAVLDIGFEQVTTKRVAEHLGISVAGLYYYVRGRDDLILLGSEYALARKRLPEDIGQHWAAWLREWAWYMRGSMGEYEIMEHYITGTFSLERTLEVSSQSVDVLVSRGFDREQARMIWSAVSGLALGSAVDDLRWRELVKLAADGGAPDARDARRAHLAPVEPEALRSFVERNSSVDRDANFDERVTTLLIGIAIRCDRDVDDGVLGHR